jgi:dihydroorotate dehydrogenase electron transfer subunit
MKKYLHDLLVAEKEFCSNGYLLLKLTTSDGSPLPEMRAGQFVEVKVEGSPATFLRRPISINCVDRTANRLWLLIHVVGEGTRTLARLEAGDKLNLVYPLGNGFTMPRRAGARTLLVGGGVGTAPMLGLGVELRAAGHEVTFLLGARSAADLCQLDDFARLGRVMTTTEDGSMGERGYVTQHSVLAQESFDVIYTCGPKPMMKAVARYALDHDIECEASLENMMACGVGACLCCVEDTKEGHVCVCKEGPVFNVKQLKW